MPIKLPPLSLYIHIPWCVRKCPYCDFNSHTHSGALPVDAYVRCLLEDLDTELQWVQGRKLKSVFFGGGTPSLMPAEAIGAVLNGVRERLELEDNAEITLETNPGTAEYSNFDTLLSSGVNRLSFGAQSFNDSHLQTLGRIHSGSEIIQAVARAKSAGFTNFNIDLMHSLPEQNLPQALEDIKQAIELEPAHISWYQLTIEPNTVFHHTQPVLPDDDTQSDIFEEGVKLLETSGYTQYEISAYAKTGFQSAHNLNYWRFGDYLAIGAGAHGKVTIPEQGGYIRYQKTRMPNDYLDHSKPFRSKQHLVEEHERPLEFFMNVLSMKQGVYIADFENYTGLSVNQLEPSIQLLREQGLLVNDIGRLAPSPKGLLFLNDILEGLANEKC